jgi:hypothetical protein
MVLGSRVNLRFNTLIPHPNHPIHYPLAPRGGGLPSAAGVDLDFASLIPRADQLIIRSIAKPRFLLFKIE